MKRVLVVDDSATVRQQVSLALTEAGYDVVEAIDGADGLDRIKGDKTIAMVISDVNMPKLNGIEMLEALKRDAVRPGLPVVMLTTEGQTALLDRAKAAGAKGWMVKPFNPAALIGAVKKLAA
jgi:two-component system chemotaxis response regulator CheY